MFLLFVRIMHVPEFCTPVANQPKENGRYVSLLSVLMQPLSRGSVVSGYLSISSTFIDPALKHATSSDPFLPPIIDPRYYSNPADLELMVQGLKYVQKLANTEPLASLILKPADPRADQLSDEGLESYARSLLESAHHPVGTASMLPRKDGGVVSSELKVCAVSALGL